MSNLVRVSVPKHLKDHVSSINESLRQTARIPSRPSPKEIAPHVAALMELGYNDKEINSAFGWEVTGRYLRKIKQVGRMEVMGQGKDPEPRDRRELPPEYAAMLEWSPEAFIAFYDRFNSQPMPEHCREWVQEVFDNDLLMLNVPPRHNKSTLFAIWWPVWNIVRNRNIQILIISLTGTLATRWVGYISALLSYGDIPKTFGRFKPETQEGDFPWRPSQGELMVTGRTREGSGMQFSILSRSEGKQILGFEADMIVVDDVTSKKIATSEAQRRAQIEWIQEEVFSRLQPDGRAIVIGQRVHPSDVYGHLESLTWDHGAYKDEPIWTVIKHPAVLTWPEQEDYSDAVVLWPEVWDYERLMKSYALVGGKGAFFTMYQQDPQSGEATLVREEWLERCRDYDRAAGEGVLAQREGEEFMPVVRVASLDPSPTQYNGLIVADVFVSRAQFFACIVDVKSFKADWAGIRREILDTILAYKPTYFVFEKNIAQYWAKGDPFIAELQRYTRVLEHTTSAANKYELEVGLESLSFDFEMANVRLPYKDSRSRNVSNLLEREARNWTREGRLRDDVLMAFWFIKYNYKRFTPLNMLPTKFTGSNPVETSWRRRLRAKEDRVAEYRRLKKRRQA